MNYFVYIIVGILF